MLNNGMLNPCPLISHFSLSQALVLYGHDVFCRDNIEIEITSCSLGLMWFCMVMQKSVLPNRGSIALEDSEEEDGEEVEEEDEEDDGSESSSDDELPVTMIRQDAATQSIQKDLLLVLCHSVSSLLTLCFLVAIRVILSAYDLLSHIVVYSFDNVSTIRSPG